MEMNNIRNVSLLEKARSLDVFPTTIFVETNSKSATCNFFVPRTEENR